MTISSAPPDGSAEISPATVTVASPAPPSWQLTHTGLFFLPALVVLAVAAVKLWREQSQAWEKV